MGRRTLKMDAQASTNAWTTVTESIVELDADKGDNRAAFVVAETGGVNAIEARVVGRFTSEAGGSDADDSSAWEPTGAEATITAGAQDALSPPASAEPFTEYAVQIKSAVSGSHGAAKVWGAARADRVSGVDVAVSLPDADVQRIKQALTKVTSADTALVPSDGAALTIAQYEIDLTVGRVYVNGVVGAIGALNDQPIVGTDAWAKSFKLDGTAAAVLSADGKTYDVAFVVFNLSGTPTLYAIFGAEEDDGSEAAPTAAQIKAAIEAADITGLDSSIGLIVGRTKFKRVAVDTITPVHTDPASDEALKAERALGTVV